VDARFSSEPECNQIHADVRDSGDLTGNRHKIHYQASVEIGIDGTKRDIGWMSDWDAETWLGDANGHDDLTIVQDTETFCLEGSGTSRAKVANWSFAAKLDGVKVCPNACPDKGTIEVTADGARRDEKITIAFDGTDTAHAVGAS